MIFSVLYDMYLKDGAESLQSELITQDAVIFMDLFYVIININKKTISVESVRVVGQCIRLL